MTTNARPLAIVTGASAGIGYELAKLCAENGFDLLVAADQPEIQGAAQEFRGLGAKVGQQKKDDAADVAKVGFDAMMKGDGDVVSGLKNKVQVAMSGVVSPDTLAERNRKLSKPGTGKE